jgi:hypothetical protein
MTQREQNTDFPAEGGCACGFVRFRLKTEPLFVHCCHCRWCQRETGSAFALNAMIETNRVEVFSGEPETVLTPSHSGNGQQIVRCPRCRVAVWSHYAGSGKKAAFVRVGTLDNHNSCPPDIHIFTESKQAWVQIPDSARAFPAFYDRTEEWPAASLARREALMSESND